MRKPWWGLKNTFDRLAAALLLVALSPIICLIVLVIVVDDGWPVLFTQQRAGRGMRTFSVIKFRTMHVNWEARPRYNAQGRDQRYTRVGPLLRKLALDELPQLVNVLKGDMSLVGPRPCLPYQAEAMSLRQQHRFLLRPGITGWAQVHGRWSIPWSEKIELDLWYLDHCSPWLDAYILYLSVVTVVRGRGLKRLTRDEVEDFR